MMLGTLWQDLTHGARMLRKNPGFAFVAMASIAIGVGANAAMFSLADTLVLRPLTVPRASEIVTSFADPADQSAQRKFGMAVSGNLFDTLGPLRQE